MKAWTRRIIALVLVIALLLSLQELVMPKYASSLYEGSFTSAYYDEKREHQVLMVGDCELYENIDPVTLWKKYGITSYIRGNAQQQAWQSYYLLREALERETPKVVVFSVLSLEFDEPQKEEYNRLVLDRMKWSANKVSAIRASMTEEEHFLDYALPLLRYHSRITQLTDEDWDYYGRRVNHTVAGYYMRIDTAPYVVGTWGEENDVGAYTAAARQAPEAGDEGCSSEEEGEDEGWSAEAEVEDEGWSSEAEVEDEGWSSEAEGEDEGWSSEAENGDEGWSAEAGDEDEGWSSEAETGEEGWSAEAEDEDEGWSSEAETGEEGWSPEAEDEDERANEPEEGALQNFTESASASDVEPLGDIAMYYLDQIRLLCEQKGIKLLLVKAPSVSPVWYDVWEEQMTEYADTYGLDYINYLDLVDEIGIDFATDTYDEGLHMNYSGAIKCADYLGEYLVKHYGLEDLHSDPEISAIWEEKSDFQQQLIKKQQTELEEYGMIVSK